MAQEARRWFLQLVVVILIVILGLSGYTAYQSQTSQGRLQAASQENADLRAQVTTLQNLLNTMSNRLDSLNSSVNQIQSGLSSVNDTVFQVQGSVGVAKGFGPVQVTQSGGCAVTLVSAPGTSKERAGSITFFNEAAPGAGHVIVCQPVRSMDIDITASTPVTIVFHIVGTESITAACTVGTCSQMFATGIYWESDLS